MNYKEFAKKEPRLAPGHGLCGGCAEPIIVKTVLGATDKPVVAANATGCLEVSTTIYPSTAWKVPWIHSAFENAASTIAGVETAYKSLKRQGKVKDDIKFVCFAGDGGTYDIGLQSLSGALERGHDFLYVCLDNEAYENTGNQRSSATPFCADTTTAPAGKVLQGKMELKKDLMKIVAAHNVPYAAQASVGNWLDLANKAEKAFTIEGPKLLLVFSPCTTLWSFNSKSTIDIAKLATESCMWPLYEIVNGEYKLNYKPKEKKPVAEYLKTHARFKHLFAPGNEALLAKEQEIVDKKWVELLKLCGEGV
jgi:pyruvate ferredoxin oxidoreductase beta subunit